jgi:hypothetical protein
MMARVTIQHQCGHTTEEVIGETSSAGIGAAVAGLQQEVCAACAAAGLAVALPRGALRDPTDEALDLRSILWGADREMERMLIQFRADPDMPRFCALVDAMNDYATAWEDYEQERRRQ